MFPTLTNAVAGYSDSILAAILRWIVVMEMVQNTWSFVVFSQTNQWRRRTEGAQSAVEGESSSRLTYPWRKKGRNNHDEHLLEDVFLDEVSGADGANDDFHFEDSTYSCLEANNHPFVAQDLESFDDGDLIEGGFQEDPIGDITTP